MLTVLFVRWLAVRHSWELDAELLGLRRVRRLFNLEYEGSLGGRRVRVVSNRGSTLMVSMQLREFSWASGFVFDLGRGRLVSGSLRWLGLFLDEELYERYWEKRARLELEAGHIRLYVSESRGLLEPLNTLKEAVALAEVRDRALADRVLDCAWGSSVMVIWRSSLELLAYLDEEHLEGHKLLLELVEDERFPTHKRMVALGLAAEVCEFERAEKLLALICKVIAWSPSEADKECWLLRLLQRDPDLDIALVYALGSFGGPLALGRLRSNTWGASERISSAARWAIGQIQARLHDSAAMGNLSLTASSGGELSALKAGQLAVSDMKRSE